MSTSTETDQAPAAPPLQVFDGLSTHGHPACGYMYHCDSISMGPDEIAHLVNVTHIEWIDAVGNPWPMHLESALGMRVKTTGQLEINRPWGA